MSIGVKLQRIRNHDIVWIIYLFLAIAGLFSDGLQREFLNTNNLETQRRFHTINVTILVIAFFIYLYFVIINFEDTKTLQREITKKEVLNTHLALIASLLFLIGGIIIIFVELGRDIPTNNNNKDVGII